MKEFIDINEEWKEFGGYRPIAGASEEEEIINLPENNFNGSSYFGMSMFMLL